MENIYSIIDNCVGCGACESLCPVNAIQITENFEGFLYPEIDSSKCVNCGLCLKKCPSNNPVFSNSQKYCGGLKINEKTALLESASGGACYELSKHIIEKHNGVVYGCAWDDLTAKHVRVETVAQLSKLQSSKYVQSNTIGVYKKVEEDLKSQVVLFIGTPCQVNGLKCYLGKDYENLYTVGLICHGVPSPKLFKNYLKYLESKKGSKIIEYNFRYKKKKGWGTNFWFKCENGKEYTGSMSLDKYGSDFLAGKNYRSSCYDCKYCNVNSRPEDITVGDFWGLMGVNSSFYSEDGVSSIICHNEKGMQLIKSLNEIEFFECESEKIVKNQHNLVKPTNKPETRDGYYKNIDGDFFKNKKVGFKIKDRIIAIMPKALIKLAKKIKHI